MALGNPEVAWVSVCEAVAKSVDSEAATICVGNQLDDELVAAAVRDARVAVEMSLDVGALVLAIGITTEVLRGVT